MPTSGEQEVSAGERMPAEELPQASGSGWVDLVRRVQMGEALGMEELYAVFARGVRFYLCRQLGPQELDDKLHDAFLIVVSAIQRGELREPERLMGFIRTVVRRQIAAFIDTVVQYRRERCDLQCGAGITDSRNNPEAEAIRGQRIEIMRKALGSVGKRDRDILTRFYLLGQPPEQICAEMNLTETQFRLLKSRAKERFGKLGRRKLQPKLGRPIICVRNSPPKDD